MFRIRGDGGLSYPLGEPGRTEDRREVSLDCVLSRCGANSRAEQTVPFRSSVVVFVILEENRRGRAACNWLRKARTVKRLMVILASILVPLALCAEPAFASKMVAITFDDGPSSNTAKVVEILRTHDASATFFFVGKRMNSRPADVESVAAVGEIANHTWRHSASHPWKKYTYSKAKQEIQDTNDVIRSYTGQERIWFRTLGLQRNKAVNRAIEDTGVKYVGGVLVGDWGSGSSNRASAIKSRVAKKASANHAVLILHETNNQTVKALPAIIDWYHMRGYKVVTVSELMDSN